MICRIFTVFWIGSYVCRLFNTGSANFELVLLVFIAWIYSSKRIANERSFWPMYFLGQELKANSYMPKFSNVFRLGTDAFRWCFHSVLEVLKATRVSVFLMILIQTYINNN
jgi:hypothetical protein